MHACQEWHCRCCKSMFHMAAVGHRLPWAAVDSFAARVAVLQASWQLGLSGWACAVCAPAGLAVLLGVKGSSGVAFFAWWWLWRVAWGQTDSAVTEDHLMLLALLLAGMNVAHGRCGHCFALECGGHCRRIKERTDVASLVAVGGIRPVKSHIDVKLFLWPLLLLLPLGLGLLCRKNFFSTELLG
mmetsp:Transcript_43297/g.85765  ORF Transcript_43297/g.85765 Transcript_43297/m.85765 type:complete len:185 (-) Transcript_43297:78-632(-)